MVRDTRASANAVAAAADLNGDLEEHQPQANGSKGVKRDASSPEPSPSSKRRRRGEPSTSPPVEPRPAHNGENGTTATTGSLKTKIIIPPKRVIRLVVKGKDIDSKTDVPAGNVPSDLVLASTSTTTAQPLSPTVDDNGSANGLDQQHTLAALDAIPNGVGSVAMSRGESGSISGTGTSFYSADENLVGLTWHEREGLLDILNVMEQSLSAEKKFTRILDLPLASPHQEQIVESVAPVKARGRPKKNKGKDKEIEVDVKPDDTTKAEEMTLRKLLKAKEPLEIQDLISWLAKAAALVIPTSPNPFSSSHEPQFMASYPYKSSTSANPRAKSLLSPTEVMLLAVASIVSSMTQDQELERSVPTIRWSLHQRLPDVANPNMLQDWFTGILATKEKVELKGEEESVNGIGKASLQKLAKADGGDKSTSSRRALRSAVPPTPDGEDVEMAEATFEALGTGRENGESSEQLDDDSNGNGMLSEMSRDGMFGLAHPITIERGDAMFNTFVSSSNKLFVDQKSYAAYYGQSLPTISPPKAFPVVPPITLGQNVFSMASTRVKAYKRHKNANFGLGWVGKPVKGLHMPAGFTPTFAPSLDSSETTGGWGYDSSYRAARSRAVSRAWTRVGWGPGVGRDWASPQEPISDPDEAEYQMLEARPHGSSGSNNANENSPTGAHPFEDVQTLSATLQQRLDQNATWVQELTAWQDIRLRRGQVDVHDDRESQIAAKLATSLQEIVATTSPASLLPSDVINSGPLAVVLANKIISTPSPIIRGNLDPDRRQALVDNTTVEIKSGLRDKERALSTSLTDIASLPPHSGPSSSMTGPPRPPSSGQWFPPPPHGKWTPDAHSLTGAPPYLADRPTMAYPTPPYGSPQPYPSAYSPAPQAVPYGAPYGPGYAPSPPINGFPGGYSPSAYGTSPRVGPPLPGPGYNQSAYGTAPGRTVQNSRGWSAGPSSPAPGAARGIGAGMGITPGIANVAMRVPSSLR